MTPVMTGGTGYTLGSTSTSIYWTNWSTAGTWTSDDTCYYSGAQAGTYLGEKDGMLVAPKGRDLLLPDGTVLHIDDMGNVRIDDAQAKVIYRANRMREFNPYVNASDLLAKFIRYLGDLGLSRADAGQIPIVLFVNWLVIEAATADGDPIPDDVVPPEAHPFMQRRLKQIAAESAA